jgi:5'-3' exoribonuclease 2
MNQQRARRFRAAKDAEDAVKKQELISGMVVEHEGFKFDSNTITPGTEFMH